MAVQRFTERTIYPGVKFSASEEQIGWLILRFQVSICLEHRTTTPEGLIVYRDGDMYTVRGTSDNVVRSSIIEKAVNSEIEELLLRLTCINLPFEVFHE